MLPLEFFFRLYRSLDRFVSNNALLSSVQIVGADIQCGNGLSIHNDGFIKVGNSFQGANSLQVSTYKGGAISIGERCFFGDFCKVIADNARIIIGDDCLIAERVSIRASNHGTKSEFLINTQLNVCKDISIGRDVWIGCGTIVLAGSVIPDGVVIGANSVVIPNANIEKYCIYAGNPIKKIRER